MERIEKEAFLAHATLPTFKRKVEKAKEIIREALAIAPAYVAVSWGKDSVVMLHLVQSICPDILVATWEDENQDLQSNYSEVKTTYFMMYPTNFLSIKFNPDADIPEQGLENLDDCMVGFVGCRAQESMFRAKSVKEYGVIHQYKAKKEKGKYRVYPLAYWATEDVWAYLLTHELPYLSQYEADPYTRTSIIHNFNLHRDKTHDGRVRHGAFSKLKKENPAYYELYLSKYPEIAFLT